MENPTAVREKRRPTRKTMLLIYFFMILMLLVLSVTATFAWFSLSQTPRVSNLSMYVTSRSGLELALTPDSERWGSQLSYLDMVSESTPLRPVTWSHQNRRFYTAMYGIDGRITGNWEPLSDERNANKNNYDGYYCLGTFYARTSQDVTVSLTPPMEAEEGINGAGTYLVGAPLWNDQELAHVNAGQGAENAVRIGIRITPLGEDNQPLSHLDTYYIYEPNCDTHADGQMGYIPTPSIDGDESLVPFDQLILQNHSTWREAEPVQDGVQIYEFGSFTTPVELFTLDANQKVMIRLYLWLEGQDVDCTNEIREAQIIANLQFKATPKSQSGLTPIS